MDEVITAAAEDAKLLTHAGFPSLAVENFGDAPFFADDVPAETVAAMTLAVAAVRETGVPVGVNVLRNDALSALGIAAATGARFIRVNVLTGMMNTDQGPIIGRAAELQRKRAVLAPEVEVWADVMVKHAVSPPGLEPARAAEDTVERGLADAVIFSGTGTGTIPDLEMARLIRRGVPEHTRIVAGSGVGRANLAAILEVADTVIVGSDLKEDGVASRRPDPARVDEFVKTARERGLV